MSDRDLLLIKTETTYGTNPVANAANTIFAENVRMRLLGGRVRGNPAKPGVGRVSGQIYGQAAEISFEVPLAASGVAGTAPKWGPLIIACGWAETIVASTSVTYALAADPRGVASVAISWRDGRRSHSFLGARGRMGLKASAGQRPMLVFTFVGLYQQVVTAALPVHADATWTGWNDGAPVAQGRTTFSFGGVQTALRDFNLDPSDNVLFNDIPNQENVQLIGERSFTGKAKVTTPLPSALNFETIWEAGTLSTIALVHETTAGKIVTVNVKAQSGQPDYGDEKGEDVTTVDIEPTPSAYNLDDELAIVLT